MFIILWIISFMILVILHELWHFLLARKFWVKIYEFGIWIPPKIKTLWKDKYGTEYTLNALPLWWFIRPKWEDTADIKQLTDKDSFHTKTLWQKIIILSWWVVVNLIVAFLLFTAAFWYWMMPIFTIPDSAHNFVKTSYLFPSYSFAKEIWVVSWDDTSQIVVGGIVGIKGSLWEQISLNTWDIIHKINWQLVNQSNTSQVLSKNIGKELEVTFKRWEEYITKTWKCPNDQCMLWVYYNSSIEYLSIKFNLIGAMWASLHEIKTETILTFQVLWMLWKKVTTGHQKEAVEKLAWPIWAIAIGEIIIQHGIFEYLAFIWSISLALAIFNILPIPALDWWRVVTTTIMHLFKIPVQRFMKVENFVNLIMFVLLLTLWFFIMYQDLKRFYWFFS